MRFRSEQALRRRGSQRPEVLGHAVRKDARTRDEDVRARFRNERGRVDLDPAVDLECAREAFFVDVRARLADLRQHVPSESLARESRVHRHHEEKLDVLEVRRGLVEGRGEVQDDARLHPRIPDRLEGPPDIVLALDVHREVVDPRVRERLHEVLRMGDHEVGIERHLRQRANRLHECGSHRQVRHEVPVHYIDVEHVGARLRGLDDLLPEAVESRRQDGGGDLDATGHRRSECSRPEKGSPPEVFGNSSHWWVAVAANKALKPRASSRPRYGRKFVVVEVGDAKIRELEDKARLLRRHILKMTHQVQSGHPGGSMSACDIVTALYFHVLRVDPKNPTWPDRDRFVLSKGHACPVWYAALAERGFFPVEELLTFRKLNSRLQGHPELGTTPGVENAAGAEGQGLSFSVGLALAARMDHKPWRGCCVLGGGGQGVGPTWGAAMASSKYGPDKLTAFIDRNGIQQGGRTEGIMPLQPLAGEWGAFNWHVLTIDGHELRQILAAIEEAHRTKGRPTAVISRTVKGKGVSFMENKIKYHGAATSDDELKLALAELEAQEAAI